MPAHNRKHVIIAGAGPTGLGALAQLRGSQSTVCTMFEATDTPAGLASTIESGGGFRWEIGGHVTFSHYPTFDRLFDLYVQDNFQWIHRESWIRMPGVSIPYPFQNNLHRLPPALRDECFEALEAAQQARDPARVLHESRSFAELIRGIFGQGIDRLFMTPYNQKVWATDPAHMSTAWLGQRVAMVDADRIRDNIRLNRDDLGWGPNNRFRFPLDGTGSLYESIAHAHQDHIRYQHRLTTLDTTRRIATFGTPQGSSQIAYEHLLSTVPLDLLLTQIITDAPAEIRQAAEGLRHASGTFVGIGLRGPCPSTTSWMYFPGPEAPFYRATYLSNYSPRMAPDGHHSLLCEISRPPGTPEPTDAVERTIAGLEATGLLGAPGMPTRDDIVSTWVHHVERSYPVPTIDRDERLSAVLPWLEDRGIASRGRFGLWKYEVANSDHSVMQGVEYADRITKGTPETTIGIRYDTDGIAHVRPDVAGSGEKRIATSRPAPG